MSQEEAKMNRPEVRSARMKPKNEQKITREELQRQIKKMRDRDNEMVTGIFKNNETPSRDGAKGSVLFPFKMYPGDQNVVYELWDGERYTLPRGVARHLNNNCFYKEYQHLQGQFGDQGMRQAAADGRHNTQTMQSARKIHRFSFHSLDYMDDDADMYPSKIVEVTVSP